MLVRMEAPKSDAANMIKTLPPEIKFQEILNFLCEEIFGLLDYVMTVCILVLTKPKEQNHKKSYSLEELKRAHTPK